MSLPVNLKNDILNPNMNGHRKFNIVDENGDVVLQNVRIQDVSSYLQVGSTIDADVVNEQNAAINALEDVPDDISAINVALTDKTTMKKGSLTAGTGYNVNSATKLFKINNVANIIGNISTSNSLEQDKQYNDIATIPEGFRPSSNIVIPAVITDTFSGLYITSATAILLSVGGISVRTGHEIVQCSSYTIDFSCLYET